MTDNMVAQLFQYAAYTPAYRKADPTAYPWLGHLTFANMLVREFPPKLLVELGTLYGVSFFSFCQAIAEAGLDAQAVAVDSWEGDSQAGFYGEEVFDSFKKYLDGHYAGFARYMRCYFDEAVGDFADETIDILHIDGLHSYEAVRHDFDTWLPKVRPGGIILFHDVCEIKDDFGAYKVWAEIMRDSDEHFLFTHSHGLGVWRKPGGEPLSSIFLTTLLQRKNPDAALIDAVLSNTAEKENFAFQLQTETQRFNTETQRLNMEFQRVEEENEASLLLLRRENASLRQEIDRFQNSRSWRITRPLRTLGKLLRR